MLVAGDQGFDPEGAGPCLNTKEIAAKIVVSKFKGFSVCPD